MIKNTPQHIKAWGHLANLATPEALAAWSKLPYNEFTNKYVKGITKAKLFKFNARVRQITTTEQFIEFDNICAKNSDLAKQYVDADLQINAHKYQNAWSKSVTNAPYLSFTITKTS